MILLYPLNNQALTNKLICTFPYLNPSPSPHRGEGWGEGELKNLIYRIVFQEKHQKKEQ